MDSLQDESLTGVALDLQDVDFVDTAGIALLRDLEQRCSKRGLRLTFHNLPPLAERFLGQEHRLVVFAASGLETPYELAGQVQSFCLQHNNRGGRAMLQAEALFTRMGQGRELLFHENYLFRSRPLESTKAKRFAEAMNELAARLSSRLRRDLCQLIKH